MSVAGSRTRTIAKDCFISLRRMRPYRRYAREHPSIPEWRWIDDETRVWRVNACTRTPPSGRPCGPASLAATIHTYFVGLDPPLLRGSGSRGHELNYGAAHFSNERDDEAGQLAIGALGRPGQGATDV